MVLPVLYWWGGSTVAAATVVVGLITERDTVVRWKQAGAGVAVVALVLVGCSADQDQEEQSAEQGEADPWPLRVTSAVEVTYHLQERDDALGPAFAAYEIAVEIAAPSGDAGPCGMATGSGGGVSEVTVTLTNTDDGSSGARSRGRVPYLEALPVGDAVGPLLWSDTGGCVEEIDALLGDWSAGQEQVLTGYLGHVPVDADHGDGLGLEVRTAAPYWEIVDGYAEPLTVAL